MKCNIRGNKIDVTEAIKNYIEEKMGKLDKYFKRDDLEATILIKTRGNKDIIEVTIPTDKFTLRSEEEHDDLYAAIDLVTDKLERQIRKNKTKLKKQNINDKYKELNFDFELSETEKYDDNKIVKRKKIDIKPMSEEEAILQMELLGHTFFVYKDSETGDTMVLYKRHDGNYGIIETI